jgi:hypothetical protein
MWRFRNTECMKHKSFSFNVSGIIKDKCVFLRVHSQCHPHCNHTWQQNDYYTAFTVYESTDIEEGQNSVIPYMTPSIKGITNLLLAKVKGLHLVKEFPHFMEPGRFITSFKRARYLFLFRTRVIHSMPSFYFLKIHLKAFFSLPVLGVQ